MTQAGLAALEAAITRDLALLEQPARDWVPPRRAPDGTAVVDVAVLGAGMAGLALGFELKRLGMARTTLFDRAPDGAEGPWDTWARMRTLRSPKALAGPALGLPNLTFRAWFEAQFGAAAWEAVVKIPRRQWMDYLRWYRRVAGLDVRNGVDVARIVPDNDLFLLHTSAGAIHARHVVLATGRGGLGGPMIIAPFGDLPRGVVWAHSSDPIDFAALRGRRVVVVGGGASAFDNAGEALEAGAGEVRMLIRRPDLPRVNKLTGVSSPGLVHGWRDLPDDWRWRLMRYNEVTQTPAPRTSVLRVTQHPNAALHLASPLLEVRQEGAALRLRTPHRELEADFVILGTGFGSDVHSRPELADIAADILLWKDIYTPPPEDAEPGLGTAPYLGPGFEFLPRPGRDAPYLARLHCFNFAATLSQGKLSGDIPAISQGAERLARAIASRLFTADVASHWQAAQDYAVPELLGDEWVDVERAAAAE